jgi:hypothetical protein
MAGLVEMKKKATAIVVTFFFSARSYKDEKGNANCRNLLLKGIAEKKKKK